mgnify:CR=1 FL=1
MHNIKLIRDAPDKFEKKIKERNTNLDLKKILDLDKKNRDLIQNKENQLSFLDNSPNHI